MAQREVLVIKGFFGLLPGLENIFSVEAQFVLEPLGCTVSKDV